MRLESELTLVKDVAAGQGVSYGYSYVTDQPTRLGLVPLGYGDGIPRHASNAGPCQVGGRVVTVAGKVCMDQFVVDLGPGAEDRPGDPVVLFGDGHGGEPTAEDWAHAAGTISYEITTRLGRSVPRVYVDGSGSSTPAHVA
jgi:alanine racemase